MLVGGGVRDHLEQRAAKDWDVEVFGLPLDSLERELRRLGLAGTEMARAQCGTIRLKLLKIGARVRITARRIWVAMSESCPYKEIFFGAWARLQPVPT